MSEQHTASQLADPGGGPDHTSGPGVGPYLRQVRENAGIHIAALAQALKVPVARLEALEADRLDEMPDPAFARALTATICRLLQVDPVPVLARLPQRNAARLVCDTRALSKGLPAMPVRKPSLAQQFPRPLVWVVVLLLVGAGALMLLPRERIHHWMEVLSRRLEHGEIRTATRGVVQEPVAAQAPTEPVAAVEPSAPAVPTAAAVAAAPAATEPAAVADSDAVLVLKATADSWIKISDARGGVVFQKMLSAGDQQSITAPPPLAVVVGRADGTQVTVRGKPLDLSAIARSNVARFEVK
ncbi:helix-turn-helix domain-containing protein [Xylophilus ampelinus]|uniref:Cytoskeleton protein RodZ n=1 Tax=Xylophilus ampelinus TaxID=54067 RepID=A0A318SLB0_9BURK|nr:helix-turn-helix domain-containing protein [Xylophilus ampelinus]MCS4509039.1 helix-turn-helix domain-containing protein [Xylophilus ampelinus]PYE79934.1 cytoskeleton protein RodZ [Xylophilus ampelinus]